MVAGVFLITWTVSMLLSVKSGPPLLATLI